MSDSLFGYTSLQLRGYVGLTQAQYALMLGVSQASVSMREKAGGQAAKWEALAVKGALFCHGGQSGCLCKRCCKARE